MSKKSALKKNRLSNVDLIVVSSRLVEFAYMEIERGVISRKGQTWFVDINGKPCMVSVEVLNGLPFSERYPNRDEDIEFPF